MYKTKKEKNLEKLNQSTDSFSYKPVINKNTSMLIDTAKKRHQEMNTSCTQLEPKLGYNGITVYLNEKSQESSKLTGDPRLMKLNLEERLKMTMNNRKSSHNGSILNMSSSFY